jgi:hypothetical protein
MGNRRKEAFRRTEILVVVDPWQGNDNKISNYATAVARK